MSEVEEVVEQEFELEEISESELLRIEQAESDAAYRRLVTKCERLLQIPASPSLLEALVRNEVQRVAVQKFDEAIIQSDAHASARRKIDEVVAKAQRMTVEEFRFCLDGALDSLVKARSSEAEHLPGLAIAFDEEIPELAEGLAGIWKAHLRGEVRESMKRAVYKEVGL